MTEFKIKTNCLNFGNIWKKSRKYLIRNYFLSKIIMYLTDCGYLILGFPTALDNSYCHHYLLYFVQFFDMVKISFSNSIILWGQEISSVPNIKLLELYCWEMAFLTAASFSLLSLPKILQFAKLVSPFQKSMTLKISSTSCWNNSVFSWTFWANFKRTQIVLTMLNFDCVFSL